MMNLEERGETPWLPEEAAFEEAELEEAAFDEAEFDEAEFDEAESESESVCGMSVVAVKGKQNAHQ
ncbi:hypothetical protein [Roseateles sp. MS654]|uniref:hypothetical protein n=1 Tax=Roseateles sp. MS654 TaxID=3412685 RepID=UPI003C2C8F6D